MYWEQDPNRPNLFAKYFINRASNKDIDTTEFRASLLRVYCLLDIHLGQ